MTCERGWLAAVLLAGLLTAFWPCRASAGPQADAAEIAFWESVRESSRVEELEAYLRAYPEGHFAALARIRLEALGGAPVAGATAEPAAGAVPDPRALGAFAFDEGVRLMAAGDHEAAIGFLQMAAARDPERGLFREVLGDAYLALGDRVAAYYAIEAYGWALEIEPGRIGALAGLRQAALLADEPLIALEATEALFLHDGRVDLALLPDFAVLCLLLDQADRCKPILFEARDVSAAKAPITLVLAALHQHQGELEIARRLAEEALAEAEPGSALASQARALIERTAAR